MPLDRKLGLDLKLTSTFSMHEWLTANQEEQTHEQETIHGNEQGQRRDSRVDAAVGNEWYGTGDAAGFAGHDWRGIANEHRWQILLQRKSVESGRTGATEAIDGEADCLADEDSGNGDGLRIHVQSGGCLRYGTRELGDD